MESYRDALQRARDAVQDSSEEVVKLRKEFDEWPQHNELDKGRSLLVGTHRRERGHRFSPWRPPWLSQGQSSSIEKVPSSLLDSG